MLLVRWRTVEEGGGGVNSLRGLLLIENKGARFLYSLVEWNFSSFVLCKE